MSLNVTPVYNPLFIENSEYYFENRNLPLLEIYKNEYKAKYGIFKNVIFDSLVYFNDCDLNIGILFDNCTFTKGIQLTNIKANGVDLKLNPFSESLLFKNCLFHFEVLFEGLNSNIERSIVFDTCTFFDGLNIQALNIKLGSISIKNCTIDGKLDLFEINAKQDLILSNNINNALTRIEGLKCSTLAIVENNIFSKYLHIRYSILQFALIFNNGVFKEEINIVQLTSLFEGLTIFGSIFEKSVTINFDTDLVNSDKDISKYYLNSAKFNNGIYVNGNNNKSSDFQIVDEITIIISAELKGNIVFSNLEVGQLYLSGYNTSANLTFERLFINQIRVESLINTSGLIFSDIKGSLKKWYDKEELQREKENSIYIKNSNLGKTQFYQFDFTTFKNVSLFNNIFTEISTSLVNWFTHSQLEGSIEESVYKTFKKHKKKKDEFSKNHRRVLIQVYKSRQEIYRQLKYASQKQGDIPQSLAFQRHEMDYLRKITNVTKPRNWNEYFILFTNQSNDFGQDWIKASKWLLIFTFLSYVPLAILTSENLNSEHFACNFNDVILNLKVIFYSNIRNWLILLNPTHRITDLDEKLNEHSSWIYFWDILSRIIVSYFIYQIISSFRKFNK